MSPPKHRPIGLLLTQTAKAVSRAFDASLGEAGGSLPVWLILLSLKTRDIGNQRELADAVHIQSATLSHHLNGMETSGLVTRRRDPDNRRVHLVELTPAGHEQFHRLRSTAVAHDERVRAGMTEDDIARLAALLGRMSANVRTSAEVRVEVAAAGAARSGRTALAPTSPRDQADDPAEPT